jgi:hypothetical protein
MTLASIRLPVVLVERLDNLADMQGVRRSDVIRDALAAYVVDKTSSVGRDEAEHAPRRTTPDRHQPRRSAQPGRVVAVVSLTYLAIQTGGWGWWLIALIFAACTVAVGPVVAWVQRTPRNVGTPEQFTAAATT